MEGERMIPTHTIANPQPYMREHAARLKHLRSKTTQSCPLITNTKPDEDSHPGHG